MLRYFYEYNICHKKNLKKDYKVNIEQGLCSDWYNTCPRLTSLAVVFLRDSA